MSRLILLIGILAIYFSVVPIRFIVCASLSALFQPRLDDRQRGDIETKDPQAVTAAVFLIFELFELKRRGYVSRKIWTIWDSDIVDLFRSEAFREQWDSIRRPRLKITRTFCSGSTSRLTSQKWLCCRPRAT